MQKVSVTKIDQHLFAVINGYAKKSKALDFFAVACATWIAPMMFAGLLVTATWTKDWYMLAIPLAAAVAARFLLAEIVYFLYPRRRPSEIMDVHLLIEKPNHSSFPSGHSIAAFALSTALIASNFPLAVIFLIASFLMGVARIFCGVHWPSDIIFGGLFGTMVGLTFLINLV